jgi:chromosome segregation ATPase
MDDDMINNPYDMMPEPTPDPEPEPPRNIGKEVHSTREQTTHPNPTPPDIVAELRRVLQTTDQDLTEATARVNELKTARGPLDQLLKALEQVRDEIKKERSTTARIVRHAEDEYQELEQWINHQDRAAVEMIRSVITDVDTDIRGLQADEQQLLGDIPTIEKQQPQKKAEVAELQKKVADRQKRVAQWSAQIKEARTQVEKLADEVTKALRNAQNTQTGLMEVILLNNSLRSAIKDFRLLIDSQKQNEFVQEFLTDFAALNDAAQEVGQLQVQLDTARQQLANTQKKLQGLQKDRAGEIRRRLEAQRSQSRPAAS